MAFEVAEAFVSLMFSAKGAKRQISDEMNDTADTAGKTSGRRFGKVFATASIAPIRAIGAAAVGLFALDKAKDFITGAVSQASDLNETVSKSNQIFGSAGKQVLAWSRNSAKSFGLSQQQALDLSASYGDMFRQLGAGAGQAAKLSEGVVQMAADFGSFNNLPTADVAERIQAAYRGEYDSLQSVIPNINAARVEQVALNTTHKKSAKNLTALDKALAVNTILQKDGARAQGDFARTSGGLANQQKILGAQWTDMKARLGTALLPLITKAVSKFNEWLPTIIALGQKIGAVLGPAFKTAGQYLSAFLNGLKGGSAGGSGPLVAITNAGGALRQKFLELLPTLRAIGAFIRDTLVPALVSFVQWISANRTEIGAWVAAAVKVGGVALVLFGAFRTVVGGINLVKTAFAALRLLMLTNPFTLIIAAVLILAVIIVKNWSSIKAFLVNTWRTILTNATAYFGKIRSGISSAVSAVVGFVKSHWPLLLSIITGPIGAAVIYVVRHWDQIKAKTREAFNAVVSKVTGALSSAKRAVSDGVGRVVGFFKSLPGKILRGLGDLGGLLYGAGEDVIRGLINGIRHMAGAAVGAAKGVVSDAVSGAKNLLGINSPSKVFHGFGVNIGQGLVNGMVAQTGAVSDAAEGLAGSTLFGAGQVHVPRPGSLGSTIPGGAGTFEGTLVLDSGEFLGTVRGQISEVNRGVRRRAAAGAGGIR